MDKDKKMFYIFSEDEIKTQTAIKVFFAFSITAISLALVLLAYFIFTQKPAIVDIVVVLLFLTAINAAFIGFYKEMVKEYVKIKNQFTIFDKCFQDIKNIRDFVSNYEVIKEKLYAVEHIGDIWREFCETLIPIKENNEIVKFQNTAQAEIYINEDSMIKQQMQCEKYEAMPGILTGLGLIGTFSAITIALMGFDMENLDSSISNLLGGLSVKFLSSLFGIGTSICFLFIKEHLMQNLRTNLSSSFNHLNKIFPRRTTEHILTEILFTIKEQQEDLKIFLTNTDFQEAIKKGLSLGLEDLKPTFNEIKEVLNISNEMMKQSLEKLSEDFKSAMAELGNVVNELKGVKQESSAALIEKMIEELKSCMVNMQDSFTDAIVGGSSNTIGGLQKALSETAGFLAESKDTYNNFLTTLSEQMTKNSIERDESVNKVIAQTIEKVNSINSIVQNTMETQSDKLNNWVENLNNYISQVHNNELNVKDNYNDLLASINSAIERQKETAVDSQEFIDKMVQASKDLNTSANSLISAQNAFIRNAETQNESNKVFISKMSELNSTNDNINRALENNIEVVKNQNSIYNDINSNTAKLVESLAVNVDGFIQKTNDFQSKVYDEALSKLGQQLSGLNGVVQQQKDVIDELADTLETLERR